MGRLIDADVLKNIIESEKNDNDEMCRICIESTKEIIDEQPTAYDPGKAVEQLEKLKKAEQGRPDDCDDDGCGDGEQIYDDGRSQGRYEAFSKAIEIVKGGGVDGN